MIRSLLCASIALAWPGLASGADFQIAWSTIDGGGGFSSGGSFTVSGTIGQPDAGRSTGGTFVLEGGFWNASVPAPPPAPPRLTIVRAGHDVILSWPGSAVGFILQETGELGNPAAWSTVQQAAILDPVANEFRVTLNAGQVWRGYRLRSALP